MPRMHGLLVSVMERGRGSRHCSVSTSGYRGQGSDKSSSAWREEGDCRAARVERWTSTVPQSLTQFLFDVASPETQGSGELAPPSLWCGRFDFFACIGAWKRSLKFTEGGEDHVEFVLAGQAPDCQHLPKDRAEEGQICTIERRKEGRGKDWSSPIRHVLNG